MPERLVAGGERLVTDAEVMEEINQREASGPAFQAVLDTASGRGRMRNIESGCGRAMQSTLP